MRIGIIGLGSIGRRHVRMLNILGIKDIIAYRTKKGTIQVLDEDISHVKTVEKLSEFKFANLNGIIISNPTALHIDTLNEILELDLHVFVEKPFTDSLNKIKIDYSGYKIIVGYCLRFSPAIKTVQQLLKEKVGKVYKTSFYRSYYLPFWHPYADYRTEYTAKKELGGGVLRSLSHEIDLMFHLFDENVISVIGYCDKVSDLEIDSDDLAFFSCKLESGARINFELDFLSPTNINKGDFYGENGCLRYDFAMRKISFEGYNNITETYRILDTDIDKMYLNQMIDFLQFIKTDHSENASINDALNSMKIIDKLG